MNKERWEIGPGNNRVSLDSVTGFWKMASVDCVQGIISREDLTETVRGGLVTLIEGDLKGY